MGERPRTGFPPRFHFNFLSDRHVMSTLNRAVPIHDLIGVGFGPSNLALAIAMSDSRAPDIRCLFIEKQPQFTWHGNMLLEDCRMQVSFLKDLVTLRDPTSPYSFINYLHAQNRLEAFINLKTFFPTRLEYNGYLQWAAEQFRPQCSYGEEVTRIEPVVTDGFIKTLRVHSRDVTGATRQRQARNLVLALGGTPRLPPEFAGIADERIFHSSVYLERLAALKLRTSNEPPRFAVIGSGQSAAEIFLDLTRQAHAHVDLITRSHALKPADDSPLVNEIFNSRHVDIVYAQTAEARARMIEDFSDTNYAVVDVDLIEKIYELLYVQQVSGEHRHALLRNRQIVRVAGRTHGVHLTTLDALTGAHETRRYDAVILATGYERDAHKRLLTELSSYLGELTVDRQYRLAHDENFLPEIYLQGYCESTHGLSDTLLSVLATRSREIVDSLQNALIRQHLIETPFRKEFPRSARTDGTPHDSIDVRLAP